MYDSSSNQSLPSVQSYLCAEAAQECSDNIESSRITVEAVAVGAHGAEDSRIIYGVPCFDATISQFTAIYIVELLFKGFALQETKLRTYKFVILRFLLTTILYLPALYLNQAHVCCGRLHRYHSKCIATGTVFY